MEISRVPKEITRRHMLVAAGAFLAGSCTTEDPRAHLGGHGTAGKALSASSDVTYPPIERFNAYNQQLRLKAPGRDVGLLDLDAVDHNIHVVKRQLGPAFSLRLVTKSLPSMDLIEYMMTRAGTNRLMVFSEGMLREILDRFGTEVDILLGRPAPIEAARRVLADSPRAARKVRWLVDTKARLAEYSDLAHTLGDPLAIALEIDVGLRRGGARTPAELLEMLDILARQRARLRFTGFMGYDGHVPFAPPGFDSDAEFAAVHERYTSFVQAGSQAYPELFERPLVFDGGGSRTYYRYSAELVTPVNEVALGSAFLLPAHFGALSSFGLRPASFLASPVLKRVDPAEVPFAEGYLPSLAESDPRLEIAFYMVGGGFPGDVVSPEGLIVNPFMPEGEGVSTLLSNQALRNGASDLPLDVGDFVFYHPWEGSGLIWLSTAELLRNDKITGRWTTFREGCLKGCGVPAGA